jgi:uncharacterized membrane protein YuzA (DUF378 family)
MDGISGALNMLVYVLGGLAAVICTLVGGYFWMLRKGKMQGE